MQCPQCKQLLEGKDSGVSLNDDTCSFPQGCSICLGVWSKPFADGLTAAVSKAMQPYSVEQRINFSRHMSPPTIVLPGDLAYRFEATAHERGTASQGKTKTTYCNELKRHAKTILETCLDGLESESFVDDYPPCVKEEELGFLAVHVFVIPSCDVYRPIHRIPHPKNTRKGRRHNIHENSQGGDPRSTLERRLRYEGIHVWSINAAESNSTLNFDFESNEKEQRETLPENKELLEFHVAVWRRPFYLRSMYTKSRRDVSQTPFHVVDEGKRRKLGVTSVEEQITPAIVRACQGISDINNDRIHDNLIFGMAKFHASGREDLDVRMMLPEEIKSQSPKATITGRPFVYEIFDAFVLPSADSLSSIVNEVNKFTASEKNPEPRSYGRNPLGVNISPELLFVPSSSYKKLQDETENKVKHYGCLCWSEEPLPETDTLLTEKLGPCPIELIQKTPIRVLHRRANMIRTRHVLSCRAKRVDQHHFRLNISTSAGTYVKEFVHGDLGRTVPSISYLLACSTDILELDCEGIEL